MIRRPPRSTLDRSSAASDVYKRQQYVRENKIPFFGICLGMQCAVVEYANNVMGMKGAASTEVNIKTKYPVIDLMEDQKSQKIKGGTMRLGSYKCRITKGSLASKIYGKTEITERHRHRYEFNNQYLKNFQDKGLVTSGINPESGLVEIVEIKDHPFFIGVQFHPELKSTVESPQPIFTHFIKAALLFSQK